MNFKEQKKHPKETKGDLGQKKHILSGIQCYDGACGDHCHLGHTSFFVKCSCGFRERAGDSMSGIDPLVKKHRRAVTEHHLGLSFAEDDD